jgi:YVTN family beta-propeller protein
MRSSPVIPAGKRPWGIGLSPDGTTLYVANGPSDDVSVVDLDAGKEVERIKVGGGPWGSRSCRDEWSVGPWNIGAPRRTPADDDARPVPGPADPTARLVAPSEPERAGSVRDRPDRFRIGRGSRAPGSGVGRPTEPETRTKRNKGVRT